MAESGCLRDMSVQNLNVSGSIITTDNLSLQSSSASNPLVSLTCTNTTKATSAELKFVKDEGDAINETGEHLGKISFHGDDGEAPPFQMEYANIVVTASDISSGAERGKLSFEAACGTGGVVEATECLSITGGATAQDSTVEIAFILKPGDIIVNNFDLGAQVSLDAKADGTVFSGAAGDTSQWKFRCGNTLSVVAIGDGQTLLAPALDTTGLNIAGDQAADDGWEFRGRSSLSLGKLNKDYFTIGTSPAFYIKCKFSIANVSGIDDLRMGFAKVEAFNATTDAYKDIATMACLSGAIKTRTIKDGVAETPTDLTVAWVDTHTHTFQVNVSAAGVVTYLLDDVAPAGALPYTFGSIDVTPFWYHRHDTETGGAIIWQDFSFGLQ